jgi:hypothetical protein
MPSRNKSPLILGLLLGLGALTLWRVGFAGGWPDPKSWFRGEPPAADAELLAAAYGRELPAGTGPLRVYHLGHSLVGRDMPAMLAQLAPAGHGYESQLGWGASLRAHFEPDVPIAGFERENAHARFRPAHEAVISGDYDVLVLTEMIDLQDALRYHDSAAYLQRWAQMARSAAAHTRIYLYETWHPLDVAGGWLERLDRDLVDLWERRLVDPDLLASGPERPVWLIPAGQVLAAFVRQVEAQGGVEGLADRTGLFARTPEGQVDPIHLGDLGNYLVALTHFAVLYRRSPVGLPRQLERADGTAARAPSQSAAELMQSTVWSVVTRYPRSGVRG